MTVTAVPTDTGEPRVPRDDDRHRLTVTGGLDALSLAAMASVAYGPEAIVLVLAVAGGAGLGFTLPITLSIAAQVDRGDHGSHTETQPHGVGARGRSSCPRSSTSARSSRSSWWACCGTAPR